jgi:hypothetical protein
MDSDTPADALAPSLYIDRLGNKCWCLPDGEYHREDGPAVEYASGSKAWFRHGLKHRDNGPAIEWASGGKEWYRNGQCHHLDGPAVIRADGTQEWWLNDIQVTEEEFQKYRADVIAEDCKEFFTGIKKPLIVGSRLVFRPSRLKTSAES